jgi:hypothetical protein
VQRKEISVLVTMLLHLTYHLHINKVFHIDWHWTWDIWLSPCMLNYLLASVLMLWNVSEPVDHCRLITCVHSRQCCKQGATSNSWMRHLPETAETGAVNESSWWEVNEEYEEGTVPLLSWEYCFRCHGDGLWTKPLFQVACAAVKLSSGDTSRIVL